jgi:hypothetical protein
LDSREDFTLIDDGEVCNNNQAESNWEDYIHKDPQPSNDSSDSSPNHSVAQNPASWPSPKSQPRITGRDSVYVNRELTYNITLDFGTPLNCSSIVN